MLGHITEVCPQSLESQEMGVEAPPSNLVATGLGNDSLAHACQQRSDHHDRATQLRAFLHELVALQVVEVQLVGLEGHSVES